MNERGIDRVVTLPPPAPGFMGEGHTAVPVINPNDFARTDRNARAIRRGESERSHAAFATLSRQKDAEDERVLV